ncbi:unnamed protein product [Rhizophagus irregularis]|nr:unnamed protein product [Rhizophagus irregularis]
MLDTYIDNRFNNTTYSSSRTFEKTYKKYYAHYYPSLPENGITEDILLKLKYHEFGRSPVPNDAIPKFEMNFSLNKILQQQYRLSKRSISETKIIYYEKQLPSRFEEDANVKNSELIIGQNQNYYSAFPKNESDSEDHERKYRQNSPQKKQCTQVSLRHDIAQQIMMHFFVCLEALTGVKITRS